CSTRSRGPVGPLVLGGTGSGVIPQTCRRRRRCLDRPWAGLILGLIVCYPRPVVTIRCGPSTENCLDNTHDGRAFFNSSFIILRHHHCQLTSANQLVIILSNLVTNRSQYPIPLLHQ